MTLACPQTDSADAASQTASSVSFVGVKFRENWQFFPRIWCFYLSIHIIKSPFVSFVGVKFRKNWQFLP